MCCEIGPNKPFTEPCQHPILDLVAGDCLRVGANRETFGLAVVAAIPVSRDQGVTPSTAIACQQVGQKVFSTVAIVQRRGFACILRICFFEPLLHLVPQLVVDDLKRGRCGINDLVGLGGDGDPVPGVGIAFEGVPAINYCADVGFVAQHAIAFLRIAADCAVVPSGTGG